MANNLQAFLALLKAGLWGQNVELRKYGSTDYSQILQLATEQSVIGLVASGLEHVTDVTVPQEELLQFIGLTLQQEQQNKEMNTFVAWLIEKLRMADIYALLVKGQGIAQCYEKPLWRACGDVDLLLSGDNYEKAKRFLIPLAETVEPESSYKKHLGLTIKGWMVELHGNLRSGLSKRVDCVLDKIQEKTFFWGSVISWDNNGVPVFMLSEENNAIYVFSHILDHFYKGGIGLRQICDWSRLLYTYRDSLNHRLLESQIRMMGVMDEWKAFGAMAVEYLGMPSEAMPFYAPRFSHKGVEVLKFVMEVGNFGHNRDTSYYNNRFLFIRKAISFKQRVGDLCRHASIFPMNSLRFFFGITWNGLKAVVER